MTREEAIEWLNRDLKEWENDCRSEHPVKEALKVAIKALEQRWLSNRKVMKNDKRRSRSGEI